MKRKTVMNTTFLCIVLYLQVLSCLSEVFTSTLDMMELVKTENEMVHLLKNYLQEENVRINKIKESLREMEVIHNLSSKTPDIFVENPLNSFLLIKRMTVDWPPLFLADNKNQSFFGSSTSKGKQLLWPTDEDLSGAAIALNRLIKTYKLPISEVALGKIDNVSAYREPTAHDCLELGIQSFDNKDYESGNMWMYEAWQKLENTTDQSTTKQNILKHLVTNYKQSQSSNRAERFFDDILDMNPENAGADGNLNTCMNEMKDIGKEKGQTVEEIQERTYCAIMLKKYQSLCRGESPIPEPLKKKFSCYMKHGPSPYLKIRPVKVEVAHIDPAVFVYHDVITDNEIIAIKKLATPNFSRGLVHTEEKQVYKPYPGRTSKVSWLNKTKNPTIHTLNARIKHVTGLTMRGAENLQVSNYGLGGHYEPHLDYKEAHVNKPKRNLRIATFMFYLNDVKSGGATVFPKLGVTVWPSKGSAAFWYNLLPSGEGNPLTIHGACPVLIGQKWVANKWFREKYQQFRKPCNLQVDQTLFQDI